jgi:hypothetical protein
MELTTTRARLGVVAAATVMVACLVVPMVLEWGLDGAVVLVAIWGSTPVLAWLPWALHRVARGRYWAVLATGTLLLLWQLLYLDGPDLAASSSTGGLLYLFLPLWGLVGVAVAMLVVAAVEERTTA